jgi:predicted Zn-dependent protease
MVQTIRRTLTLGLVAGTAALTACVSTQQELELGRQYAAEINKQLPIVEDAAIHRYINDLGSYIQQQPGTRDIPYTFYVVNIDQVNAFAIPGGHVYINRGLIERSGSVAELAGVVGHEIGHVEARHGVDQMERAQAANAGYAVATILLGHEPEGLAGAAVQVGAQAYFAHHSREDEYEADSIGVRLVRDVGFDPEGMVTFFRKLLEDRERTPSILEQWFATHPLTEDRITRVQGLIDALPAMGAVGAEPATVGPGAYQAFKERVRQLPPPPEEFRDTGGDH